MSHLEVSAVSSGYGRVKALDALSCTADTGICALLGPNGSGKTTLLSCIMGLKRFDGSISVGGRSVGRGGAITRRPTSGVGYLPQGFDLAGGLTVQETVSYAAWCNGTPRRACSTTALDAIDRVGLASKGDRKARTLSGGERQRLGIACAIAHRPSLLLLDEPTAGLDPVQRTHLRTYLRNIAAETCVILATHLLEDVQSIADRVIVLDDGRSVFQGSKSELADLSRDMADRSEYESPLESAYRRLLGGE